MLGTGNQAFLSSLDRIIKVYSFLIIPLGFQKWALNETMQNPVGLLGTEVFQTVANQEREGMQRQGRSSQETIVQPWDNVLVPPQGIHMTMSLSSSVAQNPPPDGRCSREKVTV